MIAFPLSSAYVTELVFTKASDMIATSCLLNDSLAVATLSEMEFILKEVYLVFRTWPFMHREKALSTENTIAFAAGRVGSLLNCQNPIITELVGAHS